MPPSRQRKLLVLLVLFPLLLGLLLALSDCSKRSPEMDRKRCEFVGEFPPQNPNSPLKTCGYQCRGYGAIATFPWDKDKPCPPSFNGDFPGP